MRRAVPTATLGTIAELNPRLNLRLAPSDRVAFVPMSAVSAECLTVEAQETRAFADVSKGYTPFLKGDVLLAKITPCFENGKIARVAFAEDVGFGSTEFHVIRPRDGCTDARYLTHFLRQVSVRKAGVRRMTGSAGQRRVPEHFLADLDVPVPHIAEQRRIAEVLDRAEALRAKRRAAIAQFAALAQSIFLNLFGDPKANPMGWRVGRMAELFAAPPIFGTMIPPVSEQLSWLSLRVANIQAWEIDLTDRKYVQLPPAALKRHSVCDGDLLLARAIASQEHLGKCVVAHPSGASWAFDSHIMRIRFNPLMAEPEFIRHLFMTPGGRHRFLGASRKSTVQFNINTKEMATLEVPIPPVALQRTFATRVAAIERLKASHRASLARLDELFASLQHRAFRGEL